MKDVCLLVTVVALGYGSMAWALSAPEQYLSALKAKGGEAFVKELYGTSDYTRLIAGVASGKASWLRVAAALRPFTDAGFSSELDDAMMNALLKAPDDVTATLSRGPFNVEAVCGRGVYSNDASHYRSALRALRSVKTPTAPQALASCIASAESALKAAEQEAGKR